MASLSTALACAVCYGNAEDPMVKGAAAGVIVLGVFIFFVLLGIAMIGVKFGLRSRALGRARSGRRGAM